MVKKEALRGSRSDDFYQGNGKIYPCYEPTNISFTRDSLLWRWRRVKEFYLDLSEEDRYNNLVKKVKDLIYS